jgi:Na+/H+ antiporter NhaD/arsenite permease-like protein
MAQSDHSNGHSSRGAIMCIASAVVAYVLAVAAGWPQAATDRIVAHDSPASAQATPEPPPAFAVAPFLVLLAAIAIFPLWRFTQHWWESNLHRFYVAAALGAVVVLFYLLLHHHPIIGHFPAHHVSEVGTAESVHFDTVADLLANALLNEYVPFITLLFSLYTICGGIRIEGDMPAHSLTNATLIAVGGLLASFIGTTGAAMLMIRPVLETNRQRKHVVHTLVIFIFVVCNCGGCLLPLGDPPLFLGYLQGVPFLWTLKLWREWLFINGALLAIYFLWDRFYFYRREAPRDIARDETNRRRLRFGGLKLNGLLLVGVILSVALLDPSKTFPGTDWHPWLFLREVVQIGMVGISLLFGSTLVRRVNNFNFAAIVEVAVLFFGIFICMQPALQILNARGASFGLDTPTEFFWASGTLSSFLDNAPTYLVYFETANALTHEPGPGVLKLLSGHFIREDLLTAISLGAVFMGSMTYIGNGPNFMVKAIAESSGVKMPTFFGYMFYSAAILLPLLVLMNVIFF